MNPEEALSLGSVSQIVMPSDLRAVIAKHLMFCLRHYTPEPMGGAARISLKISGLYWSFTVSKRTLLT